MNKSNVQLAAMFLCALAIAPLSMAGVYKYVDANGNTIYTDQEPKGEVNKVEKLNVKDAYTNSMSAPDANAGTGDKSVLKDLKDQQKKDVTYAESKRKAKKEAKRSVEDAKDALEEAKVITTGDMFNNVGGGMRYTQQYLQRIEAAQMRLDKAQKEYNQF